MNLIILHEDDFIDDNVVRLSDERFLHIRDIHQSASGGSIRVGKLNGLIGNGIIGLLSDTAVEITVTLNQSPPAKLPLTVILSLPRPKMIRGIFRSIAELGVERLIVINSSKVEKSFWKSPVLHQQKIEHYLIAGLQQCRDTVMPTVHFKRLFKPFIEDELPTIIDGSIGLIAHPELGHSCPHNLDQRITLAIGPEGGFTSYEVNKFLVAGFEGIHLGNRIFRVENALSMLIAKLFS